VKLAEHNRIQLELVPGCVGIDGNEKADKLARQSSSLPVTRPEPALDMSTDVTRGVIKDWTSRKHEEHWQPVRRQRKAKGFLKPLNPELNPICYLLALLGAHHFLHISRIRVKLLTFRRLMSYIYGAPILDVSRSHTTTQHSR